MLTVTKNMSTSTIKAPPTRASIDGMFGYSTALYDDILDTLPPALPRVEDEGNTLGETILIQPLQTAGRLEKSAPVGLLMRPRHCSRTQFPEMPCVPPRRHRR